MAATRKAKAKAQENGDGGREQTRRVVLRRALVIVLPIESGAAVDPDTVGATRGALEGAQKISPEAYLSEAWVEVGQAVGTKLQAIETHAGKPGTADAQVGEFKAPPARGWQGGAIYEAPPAPLVQRRMLGG